MRLRGYISAMRRGGWIHPAALAVVVMLALSACATTTPADSPQSDVATSQALNAAAEAVNRRAMEKPVEPEPAGVLRDTPPPSRDKTTLYPGTGRFIKPPAAPKPAPVVQSDGQVTLNFEAASIGEVVKVIFDILGENYVLDPQVQGEVTIQTGRPLPKSMLIPTLETLLRMNNAALLRSDGVYKIVPVAGAVPGNVAPRPEELRLRPGYGVRIVPLQYVSAIEMAKILEPLLPQGSVLRIDPARNLLMLAGSAQELANAQETVDIFDVNWLKGMSIGMHRLQNVDSTVVATELNNLFGEASQLPLAGLLRFIPVAQTNSIIVITPQAEYLREATRWIERLDGAGGERLYVYEVKNSSADYLASLLTEVFGGGSGRREGGTRQGQVAPGRRPTQITSPAPYPTTSTPGGIRAQQAITQPRLGTSPQTMEPSRSSGTSPFSSGTSQPPAAPSASTFTLTPGGGEVRIVADTENNSLLIWTNSLTYEKILAAVRQLDVTPRQVLIEATIAEVTLTGRLRYGLQWFFKNNDVGGLQGTGTLGLGIDQRTVTPNTTVPTARDLLAGANISANTFVYALSDKGGIVRLFLEALASESKVRVLSSPQVLVIDNQQAEINVGNQQPVQSSTTITEGGNESTSITYKDTGVRLTAKPQINVGGLITLEISQEVIDVGDIDAATGQRSFFERSVTSKVAVQSGQSIVLGGLIRERVSDSQGGIPILYKVPIIGPLFGQTDDDSARTELLILITPQIVRDNQEALKVTEELKRRMEGVQPLMDSHLKTRP